MNREQKGDLPSELDMEEINKASLLVVADEKSASNEDGQEDTRPSYLLVSREALSGNENQNGKDGKVARNGFLQFLDSKFIGTMCTIQMGLW